MKVKCIAIRLNDEQKREIRKSDNYNTDWETHFVLEKCYIVLGITNVITDSWVTTLYQLRDETGICHSRAS